MKSEFEEKTFEILFNFELYSKSQFFYPFGQVEEGQIGLDAAFFSRNANIWEILDRPFWFRPRYSGIPFGEFNNALENKKIKVNLLLQYKRSEFLSNNRSKEWIHWGKPYFRFSINPRQQKLLSDLSKKVKDKALVLYAAPTTVKLNELVEMLNKREIIKNTNFTEAFIQTKGSNLWLSRTFK